MLGFGLLCRGEQRRRKKRRRRKKKQLDILMAKIKRVPRSLTLQLAGSSLAITTASFLSVLFSLISSVKGLKEKVGKGEENGTYKVANTQTPGYSEILPPLPPECQNQRWVPTWPATKSF